MVGGTWSLLSRSARWGGGLFRAGAPDRNALPGPVLFSPIKPPYVSTLDSLSHFSAPLIELSASICPTSIRSFENDPTGADLGLFINDHCCVALGRLCRRPAPLRWLFDARL